MATGFGDGYRNVLKGLAFTGLTALVLGTGVAGALADGTGTFDSGQQISGNGSSYTFAASTYSDTSKDTLYQYATGTDGYAYYNTYDGNSWSGWAGWSNQ